MPYAPWMPAPTLTVTANGEAIAPLARDAVSAVYRCEQCDAGAPVAWRIALESAAPERIDIVTVAPPR
jgi:hypothetical protein